MTLTNFQKGLIMTAVTLVAATFAQGFPAGAKAWEIFGITSLGTIITYVGKNYLFPSTSLGGILTTQDLWSSLILAVGSAISSFAATAITGTISDIKSAVILVVTVVTGYLIKTVNTTSTPTTPQT